MTSSMESELEQQLVAAKAAEDKAKAAKKAAADALRWHARNRLRINSDALDLLLEQADDNLTRLIGEARSTAMHRLKARQSQQTEAARAAVGAKVANEQEPTSAARADSDAAAAHEVQTQSGGGDGHDDDA